MKFKVLLIFLLWSTALIAQPQQPTPTPQNLVNWISLEEAMKRMKTVQKPVLLDFYTDWCSWCKHMMKTTYSDEGLAQYINNYFYPVKFNAEGKDTITYLGKVYKPTFNGPKSPHEFAIEMLNGKLSYPTTVFLNAFDSTKNTFQLNMHAAGFLERQKIEPMLVFTVENVFRNSTYEDFSAQFEIAFRDSTLNDRLKKLSWFAPAEYFNNPPADRMKTLVLIHTNWCNSCKVMERTSFIDPNVFGYVDTTYRLVNFNAENKDTINFKGQMFVNPSLPQMPFHLLAIGLCNNNLTLPTLAILDEDQNLIDAIPYYIPPSLLRKVLFFYGEDIYRKKSWQEFDKEYKD
jgi:thioredoxin-related protein